MDINSRFYLMLDHEGIKHVHRKVTFNAFVQVIEVIAIQFPLPVTKLKNKP